MTLVACAPVGVRNEAAPAIKAGQLELTEALTLERHGNTVNMLYYDASNRLVLRGASGAEQVLNEPNEKDARRSYNVLHSDGSWLYAVWRPKLIKAVEGVGVPGDKLVYFRASSDGGKTFGPIQRLNSKGGAFKPEMASSGKGDVYVAYPDERNSSQAYDIYLNVSRDHGASWKKEDIRINGSESRMSLNPSVVAEADRVHVSWMTRSDDGQFKVFVRTSEDRGETWQPPVAGHTSPNQPATPALIKTARGLLLCWGDVDAVRCSASTDHARSWSASVPVADSVGAAGLTLATDPKGRAHILIAKRPDTDKSKVNLFHVVSDGGTAFSAPQRLNGGVPHTASTILPVLAFGGDGSAMAVWVDFRYLRPVIAANYSRDGGSTWIADGIVLAAEKTMFNFFPSVGWANGGYSIAWHMSADRTKPESLIGQTEFRPGMSGVPMPVPDVARLKARVDKFWSLREQDKWGEIFNLLDPFFREGNRPDAYVNSQGSVKYFAHKIAGEPQITGNRAMVPVAYDSEVPELILRGKKVSVPRQEVTIQQEWIWVDGDWYQVFRDIFGGSTLTE